MSVGFIEDTETLVDLHSRIAEAEAGQGVSLEVAAQQWMRSARAREVVDSSPSNWSPQHVSEGSVEDPNPQHDDLVHHDQAVAKAVLGIGVGVAAAAAIALFLSEFRKTSNAAAGTCGALGYERPR